MPWEQWTFFGQWNAKRDRPPSQRAALFLILLIAWPSGASHGFRIEALQVRLQGLLNKAAFSPVNKHGELPPGLTVDSLAFRCQ